eukprot:jgi/Tetstr1/462990/TSEL_007930.t2
MGDVFAPPPPLLGEEPPPGGLPMWANLLIALVAVSFSALFSGLTLGLMSLDKHGLEILMKGGDERERKFATVIYPMRCRGNLLLCTLLIGNVIVNSFLSILLAGVTSGVLGLVTSTTLIVIFGEIVPQSLCSRHGLYVGAKTIYITWFFVVFLFPLAWPISKCLDLALGREVGMSYDKEELKELIRIHVENPDAQLESGLTAEDGAILRGALDYKEKRVGDVMTPIRRVYMLEASTRLDYESMLQIYKSGYTRIPVYEGHRNKIVGLLYTKDLILIDPADSIELRTLVGLRGNRSVKYVLDSTPLDECFKTFKTSYNHMLMAVSLKKHESESDVAYSETDSNILLQAERTISGVITLEDVLEEVIQAEIVDESDQYMSNDMKTKITANRHNMDVTSFLSIVHNHYRSQTPELTPQEVNAVESFLLCCQREFKPFSSNTESLRKLIRKAQVVAIRTRGTALMETVDNLQAVEDTRKRMIMDRQGSDGRQRPGPRREDSRTERGEQDRMLYKAGEITDHYTIILQGKVTIHAGEEGFVSSLGPWCTLGARALVQVQYIPDFTAVAHGENLVILQISSWDFQAHLQEALKPMSCVDEEDEEEEECSVLSPSDISPFEAVALLPAPSSSTRSRKNAPDGIPMRLSSRRESETSDHHDDPNRMLTHTFSLETEPHIELASRSQSESCRSFHGSL